MTFKSTGFPQVGTRFFPTRNFAAKDIPDLTGKIAVVTGGTSGIGLETAVQLAQHGADVIILGSSEARGQSAVTLIRARTGRTVRWVYLNLFSVRSAKEAAEAVKGSVDRIDILVANAGIASSTALSEDGYEAIFACNHLGHFAFIVPLISLFTGTDVRVVVVSSASHYSADRINYEGLKDKPNAKSVRWGDLLSSSQRRYQVSKLANVLFARGLQRRVGQNVFVNTLHPGLINTNIADAFEVEFASVGVLATPLYALLRLFFTYCGIGIPDGALTQLYLATSPDIYTGKYRGEFFAPIAVKDKSSAVAEDTDKQEELWAWSEKAVKDLIG